MRSPVLVASVALASVLGLSCTSTTPATDPCPTIAIAPHAKLELPTPLSKAGRYHVEVTAAASKESCTITVATMGPAQSQDGAVQSPPTRASSTCKLVKIGGVHNDGSIRTLDTVGTPARVEVHITPDGGTRHGGAASPSYTPDRCGFVHPTVALK